MVIQPEEGFKLAVERLLGGEPGYVVIAFQKLVLAFAYRVGQPAGPPPFFVVDVGLTADNETFDAVPGLGDLARVDHRAKNNDKFVMAQKFPLLHVRQVE